MTFSTRLITILSLSAAAIFFATTTVKADIFHFESFTGFPDDDLDGMEDWGMTGWFESSSTGPVNAGNVGTVFESWNADFYSRTHTSNAGQLNSVWTYIDTPDVNFQISGGQLIKPIGSRDELILSANWDGIGFNLGGENSGTTHDLTIRQYNGSFISAASVTRDPSNPVFATAIPEPSASVLCLIASLALVFRRRRIVRR